MGKLLDIARTAGDAAINLIFGPRAADAVASAVNSVSDAEDLDPESVTGNELLAHVETLPPELRSTLLERAFDIEQLRLEQEHEMMDVLADADKIGKSFRPAIALIMSLILGVQVGAMSVLLGIICYQQLRLPNEIELLITMGPPALIVLTYFGFASKERKEFLKLITTRGIGGIATGAAGLLNAAASALKK